MRRTLSREFYIPKSEPGREVTKVEFAGGEAYQYEWSKLGGAPRYTLMVFFGKQSKPASHYNFKTPEQRQTYLDQQIKLAKDRAEYSAKRKIDRSQPHTLKLGDIVYASWGYDQTNINYYQITEVVGRNTVKAREIKQAAVPGSDSQVTPVKGEFAERSEEKLYRVNSSNRLKVYSHAYAGPWKGGANYQTPWYAGH